MGGGPATAVRGEVPDAAGETYGVRGVSNSPDGAGVRADNTNVAGADVVLGGSPVAELTEGGLSRDSPANVSFNFTNPGAGSMTVQADGSNLVTAAAGSALWVDQAGDTMAGTLDLGGNPLTSVGDVALNTASEVTKSGQRFLFDDITNLSLGREALASLTVGIANTAVGPFALTSNTEGYGNTAVGYGALAGSSVATYNTAVGSGALVSTTTGGYNVAVGRGALQTNTAGVFNVAVGNIALSSATTGSYNVAIGNGAGSSVTTGSANILIGHNGAGAENGAIRIGSSGQTATFIAGIHGATSSGGLAVLVNSSGKLGTSASSRRFKQDIRDLGNASAALFELRPVSFRYKQEVAGDEEPLEYGLVAEEVAEVWPELVVRDEAGQPYGVRYHLLVPLLLNELQREHARVQAHEERLRAVLARLETLDGRGNVAR